MELIKRREHPFTEVRYRRLDYEKYWSPRMRLISKTINAMEPMMVERGHREASTYHLFKTDMQEKMEEFESRGLIFTPIYWVKRFDGFAHSHVHTAENDPDAMCYGVLTRDKKTGKKFKDASNDNSTDHDVIGGLLGYPKCCRRFFGDVWEKGFVDTIWHQAINTGYEPVREKHGGYSISLKGYPECVAMQRYWGIRVSFHLPCSFVCEETRKLAALWFDEITLMDPKAVTVLKEILSLPASWDAHRGVAVINTPYYQGMTSSVSCKNIHSVNYEPIC